MNATEYRNELTEILKIDSGIGGVSVQIELDRIDREEATEEVAAAHEINRMIADEDAESGQVPDDVEIEYLDKFGGLPTLKPIEPFS